ncbi:MAG: sterol desaturase family protein [Sphingomonas bacterium]|uniref:sterol desaturase family protein n=1 Tax=Sphingomonas bacterium TaxID=1895847 RepID=UPI002633BFFD|nr:sterol desaturase family protein [Sphingomonas bacterium]MDB5707055.1 sterol desaturase family protein [Sphingomonas bacterium]
MAAIISGFGRLGDYWAAQLAGTFLAPGSTLSLGGLICTLLLAAFLAVPRGRRHMPRLAVWRRALFPKRLVASASGRADIAYAAFSILFYGLIFGGALVSGTAIMEGVGRALSALLGPAHPVPLPMGVATAILTVALFLAYEFAYWLDHYLSHKLPILWQFHRVHHAAESLSLLTNFRVHPVDTIVFATIVALVTGPVAAIAARLLGPAAHLWGIGGTNGLIMLSAVCLTHLQHSHLWITLGPRWGRWLLGPAHHQIHHSADPRDFDLNFGSALALWDRLFGTFRQPAARREALEFGLGAAQPSPHGLRAALITPIAGALALTIRPFARRPARPSVIGDHSAASTPSGSSASRSCA